MLLFLIEQLIDAYSGFNVFQYITLRVILSVVTALTIALAVGPWMIERLTRYKVGQYIRESGPRSHYGKAGTPTMGGVLILVAITGTTLLWADLTNRYVWIALLTTLGFGCIGGIDDYRKLVLGNSRGLPGYQKLIAQIAVALTASTALFLTASQAIETTLIVPFVKDVAIPLGVGFLAWAMLVIVGSSNAVNLTDGLDGLAILPTVMVAGGLGVFAYASGNINFAEYLMIPSLPGSGELAVFCGAIIGSGLGFLWFNTYPAQVFMGDVGALSLGAALGVLAIMVRQELVLVIMGGLFVLETVSVMVQVLSFRLTGRRVFRMAPIHHHFELKGWPEPRVIVRLWIVSFILVLIGLSALKIR